MVTIKQVAKLAGVSTTTASYAMNNRPEVHPETVKKVLKAAEELNYVPNSLARSFRNKKANSIGVITCENLTDNSVFAIELMGIIMEARQSNYDILIKSLQSDPYNYKRYILSLLHSRRVDGIILLGNEFEEFIKHIKSKENNMVLLSSHSKFDINEVNVDGEKWIYKMAEYVINKGYESLAYVSYGFLTIEEQLRRAGVEKAAKDHDKDIKVISCGYNKTDIYTSVKNLIERDRPRAIMCWNDMLAMQVINVIKELDLRIPQDIAVTGFDDVLNNIYFTPSLTTVRQPFAEKGKRAFKTLVDLIDGKEVKPEKVLLDCEIVIRDSA